MVGLEACLAELDEMAARVRSETERHLYRFQRNPAEFENSEGFFRMVMLAVVLAEDFGVRYAPAKIGTAAEARIDDGFFADARDVFLQGSWRPEVPPHPTLSLKSQLSALNLDLPHPRPHLPPSALAVPCPCCRWRSDGGWVTR